MRNIIVILIAVIAISCDTVRMDGEGPVITETFNLESFSKVTLNGSMDINIIYGELQNVEVIGQKNIIDLLHQEVNSRRWTIDFEQDIIGNYEEITINITIPEINAVSLVGSGLMEIKEFNNIDQLTAGVNGSGTIILQDLNDIDILNLAIGGSGKITGKEQLGSATELNIDITGSGKVEAYQIDATDCNISISGSGQSEVTVSGKLDASISGSGTIKYKGNPEIAQDISGSGTVTKID